MLIPPHSWVPYLFDLARMIAPALDHVGLGIGCVPALHA